MIKTRYERFQLGSINFQTMWFTACSDRGPCVAIPLFKLCLWLRLPCSLFWSKRLMSLMVMMMMMMVVMVMLMMLIQIVTMLRYVEKAALCGHRLLLQNQCPWVELQHGACQNLCHLKHTPEITKFLVPAAMLVAIPLDTQSDTWNPLNQGIPHMITSNYTIYLLFAHVSSF